MTDSGEVADVSPARLQELAEYFDSTEAGDLPWEEAAHAVVKRPGLPRRLKGLFWEYDFSKLSWAEDSDLITARILSTGDWESVKWLLAKLGRKELRRWIVERGGRGLDARRLRFWELILKLPHRTVTRWIEAGNGTWARRAGA